jgi:hypothetical protein
MINRLSFALRQACPEYASRILRLSSGRTAGVSKGLHERLLKAVAKTFPGHPELVEGWPVGCSLNG